MCLGLTSIVAIVYKSFSLFMLGECDNCDVVKPFFREKLNWIYEEFYCDRNNKPIICALKNFNKEAYKAKLSYIKVMISHIIS